ncbi:hypothetical protein [Ectopseudomonas alcaliphila]|jgi:hypothetical protein|uniref:Lipoprotein n=2 Tax=Ectopseudomonas alcaliphila TaxID=101564 RepID=A0ABU4PZC5_9GAMM|nr:hypothetical protein [Pseudomonas alcaliphila]MDX5993254.1 hypothetical protein [Pseudomonas alcaliphila]
MFRFILIAFLVTGCSSKDNHPSWIKTPIPDDDMSLKEHIHNNHLDVNQTKEYPGYQEPLKIAVLQVGTKYVIGDWEDEAPGIRAIDTLLLEGLTMGEVEHEQCVRTASLLTRLGEKTPENRDVFEFRANKLSIICEHIKSKSNQEAPNNRGH